MMDPKEVVVKYKGLNELLDLANDIKYLDYLETLAINNNARVLKEPSITISIEDYERLVNTISAYESILLENGIVYHKEGEEND